MLANVEQAKRGVEWAERQVVLAHDAVRDWVQSMGEAEKRARDEKLRWAKEQVIKHKSDIRHWTLLHQAWRTRLNRHPELAKLPIGARCSCGHIAPMCEPLAARQREPGDDDEAVA